MESGIIKGMLHNVMINDCGGITVVCDHATYHINSINDCGFSCFYLPNDFDEHLEVCKQKNIISFEREDTELDNNKYGNDYPDDEEQENYIFTLKVGDQTKQRQILFGLRSYHNGYYPADVSITTTYKHSFL